MNMIYIFMMTLFAWSAGFMQIDNHRGERRQQPLNQNQDQNQKRRVKEDGKDKPEKPVAVFNTLTAVHDFNLLLNTPTDTSMCVSVLLKKEGEFFLEYDGLQTDIYKAKADMPLNIQLKPLFQQGDTVRYRLYYRWASTENFMRSDECVFRKYAAGDSFSFTVTADPHLDENCDAGVYEKTLRKIAEEKPAFHLDLGDTFMVDKYREDYRQSYAQYLAQRYYFGLVGKEAPLYLVHGNHDGENAESKRGMTEWSREQRELFFPSPYRNNYYSFQQGNTLIIILDPFGFTSRDGMEDPWKRTLGKEQFDWLEKTLTESDADHKMVFVHNLVGGRDIKGKFRGGAEAASFYEWGGYSETGAFEFDVKRRGWLMPIHKLLKRSGVKIVMHGHDHVYANQEYDGVRYLCVPQPGMKNRPGNVAYAREYGYQSGVIKNNPGFIRVTVISSEVIIDYLDPDGISFDSFRIGDK